MMSSKSSANYELEVDYDDAEWKGEKQFPVTLTGKKMVRFREIEFDHDATDDEVLAEAERQNCRQPDLAEAMTAIQHYAPDELQEHPRIGLIGASVVRSGCIDRFFVYGDEWGVFPCPGWTGLRWYLRFRFVFVCT